MLIIVVTECKSVNYSDAMEITLILMVDLCFLRFNNYYPSLLR
jgi:hypothetical protein